MTELPPTTPRPRLVIDLGPEFETPTPAPPVPAPPPAGAPVAPAPAPAPTAVAPPTAPAPAPFPAQAAPAPATFQASASAHAPAPHAQPQFATPSPPAAAQAFPVVLAGRGTRFGGSIIDGVIGIALGVAVAFPVARVLLQVDAVLAIFSSYAAYAVTIYAIPALAMGREGAHRGQTWGKQLVGVRVVMADGTAIRPSTAWLRCVVLPLGLALTVIGGLIDALWPLFDPKKRRLVDLPLGTLVVRAEKDAV